MQILNDLCVRKSTATQEDYQNALTTLRSHIDVIDDQLLDLLKKRMAVSDEIGSLKKANNVAILQNQRWQEILDKMITRGAERNLSSEFITQLFKAIHQESIDRQEDILSK